MESGRGEEENMTNGQIQDNKTGTEKDKVEGGAGAEEVMEIKGDK